MTKIDQDTLAKIHKDVHAILSTDTSGHSTDHVERVLNLALRFAEAESADKTIVTLAALLHDVDDYKLFGEQNAKDLVNANKILDQYQIDPGIRRTVLNIIHTMGYNRYLEGIRPTDLEGMVVSDADMCDSIGAQGILRSHAYSASKGSVFFNPSITPRDGNMSAAEYRAISKVRDEHTVQHFFDKLLKIPSILMTDAGKKEGTKRRTIMVDFLRNLFQESDARDWLDYLEEFQP